MGIRELPSGKWQARLQVDGQRRHSTHDNEADARAWIEVTQARATLGMLAGTGSFTAYARRWITTYDDSPKNTSAFHRSNLKVHLTPALGHMKIASITPTHVTNTLNRIRRTHTAATADACYRTLSALMNAAEQDDVILRSPVKSKKHRPRRQREPVHALERGTARRILLQMGGWQRDAALLQLSLGARAGEIGGLTAHDVDLHAGRVTIRRRYTTNHATIRATKNHRLRTLDIPSPATATLERLVDTHGGRPPIPDLQDREWPARPWKHLWLVQTSTGFPASLTGVNAALADACQAVGVPRVTSHVLRHTYVSWMIDDGHTADQIAFWIGDTPETVRRVYSHMLEGSSRPAAATIANALDGIG